MYLQSTEANSKPKQLTSQTDPVLRGFISPRGDKLVFPRDKEGNEIEQIFLLSLEEGDIIRLTSTAYRTFGVTWHPNGKEITRTVVTQKAFGIETINIDSGECFMLKEPTPILDDVHYSYDGKWIACTAYISVINSQIFIINRDNPADIITYSIKEDSREQLPSWSPNDKKLAFISEATGRGRIIIQGFQEEDQLTLNIDDEEEASSSGGYFLTNNPVWNSKSDTVYYVVSKNSRHTVHVHPLDGEKSPALPFPYGTVAMPKVSIDGNLLVAAHSSITSPFGIYLHKLGSESVKPLTPREFNIDLSLLEKAQSIWYKSFDRRNIHGWYIPPISDMELYLGVIYAHGGPWWQKNDSWDVLCMVMNSLSQSGFAVFCPNFRGSTGYGTEFQNLDIGDPGGGDLEDLIYGADWLRNKPEINNTKLAIIGGSYGGYLTLITLTKKPDAFITGVSLNPITDWVKMYKFGDPAYQQVVKDLFGGTPEEKKQLYVDRSPINHISNIKAPVMIIAAKADSRCPIEPIEKFIQKLKENNHPHKFILQKKTGHLSSLLNWEEIIPIIAKIVDFLKRNLN